MTNTQYNTVGHLFCSPYHQHQDYMGYSVFIFSPKPSTVWYIQIPTFHLWRFTVIIQCILGESVFSSDHEKYWKQKRTITRFRLYKKSFSKLNTNTTYLANMQCFSFAERIATSFCNHQSTKTKKPQKRGWEPKTELSVTLKKAHMHLDVRKCARKKEATSI